MGSCLSLGDSDDEQQTNRRRNEGARPVYVNTVVLVPQYVSRTTPQYVPKTTHNVIRTNTQSIVPTSNVSRAYYGEYVCQRCGRHWNSTLSWNNAYQRCKRCKTNVYPKNQREVRDSDIKRGEGPSSEHSMELCQKCQELGSHCGKIADKNRSQLRSRYNNKKIYKY